MKRALLFAALLCASAAVAAPQGTAFTYHGNLTADGAPLTGSVDLVFTLFDAATGGSPVGTPLTMAAFPVVGGAFTVDLDFPVAFTGQQRWVEVRVSGQTLSPRQPVNAVPVATYALNADLPNVVSVGAAGTPADNGAALRATFATLAAQPPTASSPMLVRLGPGVYDLGATPLPLVPYVQLEGAGQSATQLIGDGQATATSGVVLAANNSEVRALSVQSRGGAAYATAIYADSTITSTFAVRNVTVQSLGGSTLGVGLHNNGGSPLFDTVTVLAANATPGGASTGIVNAGGAAQIRNGTVEARTTGTGTATGVSNSASAATLIHGVQVTVLTTGVQAGQTSPDAIGISSNHATPVIQHSTIAARTTGGGSGLGIVLSNSTTDALTTTVDSSSVTVSTDGAAYAQGILNNTTGNNPSILLVRNSSITVSGVNRSNCQAFGVDAFGAPSTLQNTTITVSVGSGCLAAVGLILQGSPTDLLFNNGSIKSTQYAIYNNNGTAKIKVGASQLSAPNTASGGVVCIGAYKSDYTATTATCS